MHNQFLDMTGYGFVGYRKIQHFQDYVSRFCNGHKLGYAAMRGFETYRLIAIHF